MSDHDFAGKPVSVFVSEDIRSKLVRLAEDRGISVDQLATKLLENETEAQHGLRFGPILRKYMYR